MSGVEPSEREGVVDPQALPGRIEIPGFTLHRVIGVGAMGVVHEGVQHAPPRAIAVKVMRLTADRAQAEWIRREAEAVARCNHPSIVKVHASGLLRGAGLEVPWIAMELVEGAQPIDAWFRARRPDTDTAIRMFESIADALQHAHLQGLLHRDLKPGNILVDAADRPVVIDFGLAAVDGGDRHTEPGTLVGTMRAMPPEVIAGRRADIRSDVFSLAVCMHECLTGRWAFGEPPGNLAALARAVEAGASAYAASHSRAIGGDLRWVLTRALDPEPDRRHQSMLSLADDLRAVNARRPVSARRPSRLYRARCWVRRNPLSATLAATLAFALLAGAVVSLRLGIEAAQELERANAYLDTWIAFMARQPIDRWPADATLRQGADALRSRHVFERAKLRPSRAQMIRALALSRAYLELGDPAVAGEMIADAWKLADAHGASASDRFELDLMDLMVRGSLDAESPDVRSRADALCARLPDIAPWRRADARSVIMAYAGGPVAWECVWASVEGREPDQALMIAFSLPHLARFPEASADRLRWASEASASLLGRVRGPSADIVKKALRHGIDGLAAAGQSEAAEPLRRALAEVEANDG